MPTKNTKKKKRRNLRILDSIIFFIVMSIVTLMMLFTAYAVDDSVAAPDYTHTDEYSYDLSQALLAGTVPRVNYTDTHGQQTEYLNWNARRLLIEDLKIRQGLKPYASPADIAELQRGIESSIKTVLDALGGPQRACHLNVTWQKPGNVEDIINFHIKTDGLMFTENSYKLISSSETEFSNYDPDETESGRYEIIIILEVYEIIEQ